MNRPVVFLFDVDGTLCRTGGAGGRAMRRAFDELYGRPEATSLVDVRGNTDVRIVEEALTAIGEVYSVEAFERIVALYLRHLEDELTRTEGYVIMPGVHALLDEIERILPGSHALGLGTGNVERGARAKLRRGGLAHRFTFGGFGCDARERAELIARGASRGANVLSRAVEACRVVIVGDTPRDVLAAHAIGAECLAVATGGHSLDELSATGAELVVPTLEAQEVRRFLGLV